MIQGLTVVKLNSEMSDSGRQTELPALNYGDGATLHQKLFYCYPGAVHAWYEQSENSLQVCCPRGHLQVVLFDAREQSKSFGALIELHIGEHQLTSLSIPAGVCYGWKACGPDTALVLTGGNDPAAATPRYDLSVDFIPYRWQAGDR